MKLCPQCLFVQGLLLIFIVNSIVLCFIFHTIADLYSGLMINYLKQDLYVKSWGKMRRPLPSNCSTINPVYNVKQVRLPNIQPFNHTVDHSKWCVTSGGEFTCIADMNREESQMKRGGGAICTDDTRVGRAFYQMIQQYEPCKRERPNNDASYREL